MKESYIWQLVMLIGSAFVGWFFTRKKTQAETTTIDLNNAKELIDMYKDFNMQIHKEFEKSRILIEKQQKIIAKYQTKCINKNTCGS